MTTEYHAKLESVRLAFGRREVFHDLSVAFPRGRVSMLMGPSGSGKSTILRLLGGLVRATAGGVYVAQEEISRLSDRQLVGVRSRLSMLFQNGALLDSLSVFDNVALPLREHTRLRGEEIRQAVKQRLEAVGLPDIEDLLPGELSGGMLRRAALARAIVMDPEILLCDEPFSGLDPPNVRRIENLLQSMSRDLGLTLIVTTHQLDTALRIADRLVLLLNGRAVVGTPQELATSSNPEVAEFLRPDEALGAPMAMGARGA